MPGSYKCSHYISTIWSSHRGDYQETPAMKAAVCLEKLVRDREVTSPKTVIIFSSGLWAKTLLSFLQLYSEGHINFIIALGYFCIASTVLLECLIVFVFRIICTPNSVHSEERETDSAARKTGRDNKRHLVVKYVQDVANYTTTFINNPTIGILRYPAILQSRRSRTTSLHCPWNVSTNSK
jgi:hypothetical protein